MKNFKVDNKYITTESVFYDPRDEQYQGLIEYAKKVIAVLEISNGAAHVEFIANQDRICLIDVGARMRGGGDPWFYQEIYSSPLMWAINDKYVNDGQNLKDSTLSKYSVHLALNSSASGEFKGISNDENEALSKLPCLKELTLYPAIGQEYPQTTNLMTSVGVATIFGDRMDEVKSTVREVFSILSNHFGEWYKDIPPEIESCNENLPQSNPVLPLERAGFAAKQFS